MLDGAAALDRACWSQASPHSLSATGKSAELRRKLDAVLTPLDASDDLAPYAAAWGTAAAAWRKAREQFYPAHCWPSAARPTRARIAAIGIIEPQ